MAAKFLSDIKHEVDRLMGMLQHEMTVDLRMPEILKKAKRVKETSQIIDQLLTEIKDSEEKKQACLKISESQLIPNKQLTHMVEIHEIHRKFSYLRLETYLTDQEETDRNQQLDYYDRMEKLSLESVSTNDDEQTAGYKNISEDTFLSKIEKGLSPKHRKKIN